MLAVIQAEFAARRSPSDGLVSKVLPLAKNSSASGSVGPILRTDDQLQRHQWFQQKDTLWSAWTTPAISMQIPAMVIQL